MLRDVTYVTSEGRLLIPARLRRKYGIKPGTRVCFIEGERGIIFQPVTRDYIRSVCGMLKDKGPATRKLLKKRALDRKREETKDVKLDL